MIEEKMVSQGVGCELIKINHNPDPLFPAGVPNPLLKENQEETALAVRSYGADFGIAFDGDFDRCFFDEAGQYISGEYIVGLISQIMLQAEQGASIVHDTRVKWNIIDTVSRMGVKR